ncbi:TPA: hypothetical protein EYO12_02735 [Candidatus Saccharibacteria bacterium]|nr:hypothetical protein [Candidatus Saccharibacteria bacterium]
MTNSVGATHLINYQSVPFTPDEISNNWVVDRATPSGGHGSVSYADRDNVMEMNIDVENRSELGGFYFTEGLQRDLADETFALSNDLFVESSWSEIDVRAGLWGVGNNAGDDVSAYPITEFTTAGEGDFTGWRVWDGVLGGWTNLPEVEYKSDEWNSLQIILNNDTLMFDHYINGELVAATTAGDSVDFGSIILNNFNYGSEASNYSVHWSEFAFATDIYESPVSKNECKKGGYETFGFSNQGQCIQYVNTGKDSR